jgi:hypothetical protein
MAKILRIMAIIEIILAIIFFEIDEKRKEIIWLIH